MNHTLNAACTAVAMCVAILFSGCSMDTNFTALANIKPVDPQRYESSITAVDQEIFTSGLLDDARRESLSSRLQAVASAIEIHEGGKPVVHFASELRTLARLAERLRADLPIEDSQLQDQWMRIRNSVFDDASWFARSEADLHRPPPGPNPMLVPRAVVTALKQTLDEIAQRAHELPEELAELSVDDAPAWQESWQMQLEPIRSSLPAEPPFPGNPFLVRAIRNAQEALRTIGRLPDSNRPWEGRERESWTELYQSAEKMIEGARQDLAKVEVKEDERTRTQRTN